MLLYDECDTYPYRTQYTPVFLLFSLLYYLLSLANILQEDEKLVAILLKEQGVSFLVGGDVVASTKEDSSNNNKDVRWNDVARQLSSSSTMVFDATTAAAAASGTARRSQQQQAQRIQRNSKQCRDRWNNHLRPGIRKGKWTNDEERLLRQLHDTFGPKYVQYCTTMRYYTSLFVVVAVVRDSDLV